MQGLTESTPDLSTQAGMINGKAAGAMTLLAAPHAKRATTIGRLAQDRIKPARLLRKERERPEDLAAAYRRMNEHLALVSHELRNSLGAIRNAARLMQVKQGEAGIVEKARLIIDGQIGQMGRFLDDLVETSLLESGRLCTQCHRAPRSARSRRGADRQAVHAVESRRKGSTRA